MGSPAPTPQLQPPPGPGLGGDSSSGAPPANPPSGPGAGPGPAGPGGMNPMMASQLQPPAQMLAKLAMDAQKVAEVVPEAAPMMREVQNQVRQATMKLIQAKASQMQQAPQI